MTKTEIKKVRIAKFLANCGVASRRGAEDIISRGKVRIGDEVVTNLATKVDPDSKNIYVNNKLISIDEKVYYILNKPKGYICSVKDPFNPDTVLSLVPKSPRVVPVGRLDIDSQGLLLMTNDGDLAYEITHPKFEVKKTYLVELHKSMSEGDMKEMLSGIELEEGLAKVDKIKRVDNRSIEIVIHQGWKRQIRRMVSEMHYHVEELTRIKEGKLRLGNLMLGEYKIINKEDIV